MKNVVGLIFLFFVFLTLTQMVQAQKKLGLVQTDEVSLVPVGNILSSEYDSEILFQAITIPLYNVEPFLAVAIVWEMNTIEQNELTLFIRSDNRVKWSEWQIVHADEDVVSSTENISSALLFLEKETQFIQCKLLLDTPVSNYSSVIKSLKITFISPGATQQPVKHAIVPYKVSTSPPAFISRTEWSCPEGQSSPRWTPLQTNVSHLIVHHTAGSNSSSDWAAVVRSIWVYHANTLGWGDIGYNWLVDPNGALYQGRTWLYDSLEDVRGGHFCGVSPDPNGINNNEQTMGVSLLGTFTSVAPSDTALKTLRNILAWKAHDRTITPTDTSFHAPTGLTFPNISGHRVGCSTECPGESLYTRLSTLRLAVDSVVKTFPVTLTRQANAGWNMFSFPVELNDESTIDFPVGTSSLTRYDCIGGYSIEDTLKSGKGYWMKLPSEGTISVSGTPLRSDTLEVNCDWNFIGTLSEPISFSSVLTIPDGILTSSFFGYALGTGYFAADSLLPFQSYWIKVNQPGKIILTAPPLPNIKP
ncbi:MAG: N-acetylmuramoyl-L-alanine amidase [Ignavibacteriae bacterium]|nr:N-acetylmuramoyl-L-alanine amidase [Ignavibacteriota bacterium]